MTSPFLPLFVPADRSDRYEKAFRSGADAVVIDLEDAVAPAAKAAARDALLAARDRLAEAGLPVLVRVNAVASPDHAADLVLLGRLAGAGLAGVLLPKAEDAEAVGRLGRDFGAVIALIETPHGLAAARDVAYAASRLAFGAIDFAAALGLAPRADLLAPARFELVLAASLAGRPAPLDGVTPAIGDDSLVEAEARESAARGFGGKLLIHPRQIAPARRGFMPDEAEIAWARRVVEAEGAVVVAGEMVDAAVALRARAIIDRAGPGGVGRRA